MKKSVKRLIASTFVLFVAVCMVATTAYAWFTMSNNPSTGEFDLSVTTTDGLFISASGIDGTYRTDITGAEILGTYQAIPQLDAVTYADKQDSSPNANNAKFRDINGDEITGNGGFTRTSSYVAGRDYYEEDDTLTDITAYVTSENFNLFKNCNIALYASAAGKTQLTSLDIEGDGINAVVMTAFTDKTETYTNIYTATKKVTSDTLETYVETATNKVYRYNAKYFEFNLYFLASSPFTVYANISESTCVNTKTVAEITATSWEATLTYANYMLDATPQWNTLDNITAVDHVRTIKTFAQDAAKIGFFNGATKINIWEPDNALNTATAADLDKLQEGTYTFAQHSDFKQGTTTETDNIAIKYYNDKNNLTTNKISCPTTNWAFPQTNTVIVENIGGTYSSALMELVNLTGTGSVYKATVTLKIWIDGWDADCFDTVLQQAFKTKLEFFAK